MNTEPGEFSPDRGESCAQNTRPFTRIKAFTFSMRSAGCKLITLSVRGGCGKLRARAAAADIALREPSPFADLPSPAIARMPRARFSPARCGIAATPAESADVSNRAGLAWRTAQAATLPHTGWVDVKESLPWCPSFGYPSARNSFSVATPRLAAAMAELMPCLRSRWLQPALAGAVSPWAAIWPGRPAIFVHQPRPPCRRRHRPGSQGP